MMKASAIKLSIVAESESEESFSDEVCELVRKEQLEQENGKNRNQELSSIALTSLKICDIHKKRADLMCLNDFAVICTDCAIFGAHKHHEMKSLEEVGRDRKRRESDIGRVREECKYTLALLENDQYSQ